MAGTLHISAGFVAHGIVSLVGEGTQRRVGHIYSVGIDLEFSARRTILEVILAVVLGHVGSFSEGAQGYFVVVVHAETFPSVLFGLEHHDVVNLAQGVEVVAVQLYSFQRIFVARTIVKIEFTVIVQKKARIPRGKHVLFNGTFETLCFGCVLYHTANPS